MTHGHFPQVDYNGPFCQMFWHICEGLRNLVPRAGVLCASQSGTQHLRLADISLRCDQFGQNIHPFIELVRAQALPPAFHVALADEEGVRLVSLQTGESIEKLEVGGYEAHITLKIGGGLAAYWHMASIDTGPHWHWPALALARIGTGPH